MARRLSPLLLVVAALWSCSHDPRPLPTPPVAPPKPTAAPAPPKPTGLHFDIGAIDESANPCVDFYDYACGGWRKSHPIPSDRSRWSRYSELEALNLERVQAIVDEAVKADASASPELQRIGAFHAACMNEQVIEARGLSPLKEIFARIESMRTAADIVAVVAELQAHHVPVLINIGVDPDPRDVRRTILAIDRGTLGLPSPGDYESAEGSVLRGKYRAHLEKLFTAIGSASAAGEADRVIAFETGLAKRALSAVENRDPDAHNHPMPLADLARRHSAIPWRSLLEKMGARGVSEVNVAALAWMEGANEAVKKPDLPAVRSYFRASVTRKFALMLPRAVSEADTDFYMRTVRGAASVPPRWKRCLGLLDAMIGDDVGRMFMARHFSTDARQRAMAMVGALRASFKADLDSLEWLSPEARKAALAKLERLLVVIGGSNVVESYAGLVIKPDDAFGNTWRARAYSSASELNRLGAPADRQRFFDSLPQSLDGFGSHREVATGFTAGFLQPPTFDPNMDDAVNFGGLGGVMGHELSHQLDNEGRKFDVDGNLKPWWAAEDIARFEERAECFVDQYSRFHAEEGTPVDGKLTLSENIADNGGLRLAYAAIRPSDQGPEIDGFTPAQRFFLAWGQIRCENVSPEAERRQVKTDPHAPGRARVNGVVANMPEFARAFACPAGAPLSPAKRCRLW